MLTQVKENQEKACIFQQIIEDMSLLDKKIYQLNQLQPYNQKLVPSEVVQKYQDLVSNIEEKHKNTLNELRLQKDKILLDLRSLVQIYDQFTFSSYEINQSSQQDDKVGLLLKFIDGTIIHLLLISIVGKTKQSEHLFALTEQYNMIQLDGDLIYLGDSQKIDSYYLKNGQLELQENIVKSSQIQCFTVPQNQQLLIYATKQGFIYFINLKDKTQTLILKSLPRNSTIVNLICDPQENPDYVYTISSCKTINAINLKTLKYTTQYAISQDQQMKMLSKKIQWEYDGLNYGLQSQTISVK